MISLASTAQSFRKGRMTLAPKVSDRKGDFRPGHFGVGRGNLRLPDIFKRCPAPQSHRAIVGSWRGPCQHIMLKWFTEFPSKSAPVFSLSATASNPFWGALRMELVLSAFDHSCSGFFLFPRSMLHLGSLTSVLGKCHLDPSSLLLDMVTFGSPLSLHNAICLESFSPVSELVTFDPSLFSRSVAHLDLSMFPLGSVWIGLPPSALGAAHLDLLVSVRGFACFAASFSVLSFSHCDLSLLPQNLACTDLLLAVLGGLRLASLLLAWDATTLDFLVFLRAMAYLELKLLVLDLSSLNFMLSIKTSSCLDLLLLLCRTLQLDFSISILGSAALDFSLLPQSLGHLGVLLMVFSSIFPGFSLPLRTLAHPELSFFALGSARMDVLLLVLGHAALDAIASLQGLARLDLALLVFDMGHLDVLIFIQSFSQSDLSPSVLGRVVFDLSLSILDSSHLELLMLAHSFAQLELLLLMFGLQHLDFSPFPKSSAQLGPSISALGLVHLGPVDVLPVLGCTLLGSPPLARSLARPELSPLIWDVAKMDFPPFSRAMGCLGSTPSISGAQLGCSPSVLDVVFLGFTVSLRNIGHLDFLLPVFSFTSLDLSSLLQSFCCLDLPMIPMNAVRLDLLLLVLDGVSLDLSPFSQKLWALGRAMLSLFDRPFRVTSLAPKHCLVGSLHDTRGKGQVGVHDVSFGRSSPGSFSINAEPCSDGAWDFLIWPG